MKDNKKLYQISNLLIHLSPEIADYTTTTEKNEIVKFVQKFDHESIGWTLEEGQEVLTMEPFPWEWMCDKRGYYSCIPETRESIEDPEFYHKWLANVLDTLEAEARKQGKLK